MSIRMGGRWADACQSWAPTATSKPLGRWNGWAAGQGESYQGPGGHAQGPISTDDHEGKQRPLETNRGSASRPGPRSVRAGTLGLSGSRHGVV